MRERLGLFFGTISTVSLSNVEFYLGVCTGLLTILCLLPNAVKNWREMMGDFRVYLSGRKPSLRQFVRFIFSAKQIKTAHEKHR